MSLFCENLCYGELWEFLGMGKFSLNQERGKKSGKNRGGELMKTNFGGHILGAHTKRGALKESASGVTPACSKTYYGSYKNKG